MNSKVQTIPKSIELLCYSSEIHWIVDNKWFQWWNIIGWLNRAIASHHEAFAGQRGISTFNSIPENKSNEQLSNERYKCSNSRSDL